MGPMGALIPFLGTASVGLAVITFALATVYDAKADLNAHLGRAAAAGAIPSGLVLIYGALEPSVLTQIQGLNVPIAFGGLSLLYVSIRAMTQNRSKVEAPSDCPTISRGSVRLGSSLAAEFSSVAVYDRLRRVTSGRPPAPTGQRTLCNFSTGTAAVADRVAAPPP